MNQDRKAGECFSPRFFRMIKGPVDFKVSQAHASQFSCTSHLYRINAVVYEAIIIM